MTEPYKMEHQNQAFHDVRLSCDDVSLSHSYPHQIPKKDKGTQVISSEAGFRSAMKNVLNDPKRILAFINEVSNYSLKPLENQAIEIHRKRLHHIAITRGVQHKRIRTLRTFTFDFPKPLSLDLDIGSNNSFVNRNLTDEANQFSQQEASESSREYQQILPKQKTTQTAIENESSANRKASKELNQPEHIVKNSTKEGLPMVEAVTSRNTSSTRDIDNDEQNNSSELNSDEIITTIPNSNEQANQSDISVLNRTNVKADQVYNDFQNITTRFLEIREIAHKLQESLIQFERESDCLMNKLNLRALKKDKFAEVTSERIPTETQQIAKENQAENREEENPNISMEEDKKEDNGVDSKSSENDNDCGRDIKEVKDQDRDNEVSKTNHGHIRPFVLPPEYDPHDSRWTLKYRENDPKLNLVELVPRSKVFVNSLKLAHCKLTAKDSKELARMLLVEVFSMSALSVCSLTGVRANAFDVSGKNVRPGLDEKARMSILSFVKEHARAKKWVFDTQSVNNTLRSKIQDIRAKHVKKS